MRLMEVFGQSNHCMLLILESTIDKEASVFSCLAMNNEPSSAEAPIHHLKGDEARTWIYENLRSVLHPQAELLPYFPVEVLRFSRYASNNDAIVLMSDGAAKTLRCEITDLPPRPSGLVQRGAEPFRPAKRVRSNRPSRRDGVEIRVNKTTATEIVLKSTPTRCTAWGIDLNRLNRPDVERGMICDAWLTANGVDLQKVSEDAATLLRGAFDVAAFAKSDPTRRFRAPRLPVIHNQQEGLRYLLSLDGVSYGSPAQVQVLVHPDSMRTCLHGWAASQRPTADERKPGLLIAASTDKKVRFYQLTAVQWSEWDAARPDLNALPEKIRAYALEAVQAAERLRATLR